MFPTRESRQSTNVACHIKLQCAPSILWNKHHCRIVICNGYATRVSLPKEESQQRPEWLMQLYTITVLLLPKKYESLEVSILKLVSQLYNHANNKNETLVRMCGIFDLNKVDFMHQLQEHPTLVPVPFLSLIAQVLNLAFLIDIP